MRSAVLLAALALGLAMGAAPARAETLQQALAAAYLHNPQLRAARAGQSAAQSDVRAAQGGWYPKLALTGGIARDNTSGTITFFPQPDNFSAGLNQSRIALRLDQPLYEGGSISARISAAENSASAEHASTRAEEAAVLLDAVRAYLDVITAQRVLSVQQDNVRVIQQQRDAAQTALQHGEGTSTDVAQAESRLQGAIAARIRADSALAQARARFRTVIGHDPSGLQMPQGVPALPQTLDQAEKLAAQNFPVVAARFAAQAASDQADAAAGALLPKIGLFAEVRRENDPQYGFSEVDDRIVGLDLTVPIWQGGTDRAQTQAARDRARQAALEAVSAREQAQDMAVSAWQDYVAAHSSLRAYRAELAAARVAYQGVDAEHAHGERTLLDVLNAEQEVRNARVALVRARRDELVAGYGLLDASGQLTAATLKLPLADASGRAQ